jgi:hypothetical protein
VGAYWSRNSCVIDAAGTLYISGSSGAADSSSASYSFRGGDELQLIEMVGVESYDEKTFETFPEGRFYRIQNGKKTVIDEEEAGILFKNSRAITPKIQRKTRGWFLCLFSRTLRRPREGRLTKKEISGSAVQHMTAPCKGASSRVRLPKIRRNGL